MVRYGTAYGFAVQGNGSLSAAETIGDYHD